MPDGMSVGNFIGWRGRLQGRGATLNPAPRFESRKAEPFDDGWAALGSLFTDLPPLRTTLTPTAAAPRSPTTQARTCRSTAP